MASVAARKRVRARPSAPRRRPDPKRSPGADRRRGRLHVAALAAVLVAVGLAMFVRLGLPGRVLPDTDEFCKVSPPVGDTCYEAITLDEGHYVPDARSVVRFGTESDRRLPATQPVVHPPVGKWFIAAGIGLLGDRPIGWRLFGAMAGILSLLVIYRLGRRLWRSPWWGVVAALLLGLDGLWFVQSRVAMLEIYAAAFTLVGVWLLVEDRARVDRSGARLWRIGAGAAFGLALGSKWIAAPFVAVAVAWSVLAEVRGADRAALARRVSDGAVALVLFPALIYVATYTPWFLDEQRYVAPACEGTSLPASWLCGQREMMGFHGRLSEYGVHPAYSYAYTWPWIGHPASNFRTQIDRGTPQERWVQVRGLPNPAVWWPAFFVALPLLGMWAVRGKDPTSRLILALFLGGFVPYLVSDGLGRPVFLFYATPLVPFVVLAVVHCLFRLLPKLPAHALQQRDPRVVLAGVQVVYVLLVVAAFAYFYPVLNGLPISAEAWEHRAWLHADCGALETIRRACWA